MLEFLEKLVERFSFLEGWEFLIFFMMSLIHQNYKARTFPQKINFWAKFPKAWKNMQEYKKTPEGADFQLRYK